MSLAKFCHLAWCVAGVISYRLWPSRGMAR
jgi:hypothetical protein